jgi:uncharacterized protein with PQ loop repeat
MSSAFQKFMLVLPFITNSFIYLQAYKIWHRQSHDDLSFLTAAVSILSAAIWGYYGWLIDSKPLLLSGLIATVGFALIIFLKFYIPAKTNGWWWI